MHLYNNCFAQPEKYNGFKVSRTGALPVGYDTGLSKLEKMIAEENISF